MKQYLTEKEANAVMDHVRGLDPYMVHYRTGPIKNRPKVEFGIPRADGALPLYRFGQWKDDWTKVAVMPEWLVSICKKLNTKYKQNLNHAIVMFCGEDYEIDDHQDKLTSISKTADIFNLVPRFCFFHTLIYFFFFRVIQNYGLQKLQDIRI